MKIVALILVGFAAMLSAEARAGSVEQFVRDHSSTEIVSAAESAVSNVARSKMGIWPSPLNELQPKRIYDDRVNIVIVVKESELEESGVYIVRTVSSYLPSNDSEWTFSHAKDGIYIYERNRSKPNK